MANVKEIYNKLEELVHCVEGTLEEVKDLDSCTKTLLKQFTKNYKNLNQASLIRIQAVLDYMDEKINIGNWKEVNFNLRKVITISSYFKLLYHWKEPTSDLEELFRESYKIIDYGLVFGCPLDKEPFLLQECINVLRPYSTEYVSHVPTDENTAGEETEPRTFEGLSVDVLDCPSMEHFYSNYILKDKPAILTNCMNHWPALSKWKDQNYFIKLAGLRTVAIEVGSKYTDLEWTQKMMTIEEFIKNHIYDPIGPTGYLAQYQLFDQIPELREDIVEPEYCCFANTNRPVDTMAWYGPKGTVSPLHHDPKKNLLSQVVGEKQIFLFSPADTENLYPHEHEMLSNTAKVDPTEPNFEKHPKYRKATAYYCVLKPGQMLFIPPKWWHFVESLSVSFSVSFWWD